MANRRRFLAILLSLLMLLQALPMSALAEGWNVARSNIEEGATYHTVTFKVEDASVATQLIESEKGSPPSRRIRSKRAISSMVGLLAMRSLRTPRP